jgi:Ca-activated chloride channel homolog
MSTESVFGFQTTRGEPLLLQGATISGVLRGELFDLTIEQRFSNSTNKAIELIYTFPLASDATLLTLEVELNGQPMQAVAIAKKQAEDLYENALSDGDSAILLERTAAGICTLNLGNLMAGEDAVVRYHSLEPLIWQQGQLRILIPTTIAPRYGNPQRDGYMPHQVPQSSLLVEHPYSLQIDILGRLAEGEIDCPSHAITRNAIDQGLRFTLQQAFLDRDFILNLTGTPWSTVYRARFEDQDYLWASVLPQITADTVDHVVNLGLVLDCSGSMGGDSIAQVKIGAKDLIARLGTEDRFNIIRFGSVYDSLGDHLMAATRRNTRNALVWLESLDADMGGTETQAAVLAALKIQRSTPASDILLVTDGEFYAANEMAAPCRAAGVRLFIIGVGSSPNHADLKQLAEATGGVYEAVSPNENIARAIVHTLNRLRQRVAAKSELLWPAGATWQLPLNQGTYKDDMQLRAAIYPSFPEPTLAVKTTLQGRPAEIETIPVTDWPDDAKTLARLVADMHLQRRTNTQPALTKAHAKKLAIRFNLLSEFTHLVVVSQREIKADGLPKTHAIKNMLAAGWGGSSSVYGGAQVMFSFDCADIPSSNVAGQTPPSFLLRQIDHDQETVTLNEAEQLLHALNAFLATQNDALWPTLKEVQTIANALPAVLLSHLPKDIGVHNKEVFLALFLSALLDSIVTSDLPPLGLEGLRKLLARLPKNISSDAHIRGLKQALNILSVNALLTEIAQEEEAHD